MEHHAYVHWAAGGAGAAGHEAFTAGRYSRLHEWRFDGGTTVPASASPAVVPVPWAEPAAVDPEEAFVAAIASCHMLTFLHLAARAGFAVVSYEDDAVGTMMQRADGARWVGTVVLTPRVAYAGPRPGDTAEEALHHRAHAECFIANSVRTAITVSPPAAGATPTAASAPGHAPGADAAPDAMR